LDISSQIAMSDADGHRALSVLCGNPYPDDELIG
jgi:hypothetical protein